MRIFAWQVGQGDGLVNLPGVYKDKDGQVKHWLLTFYWWVAFVLAVFLTMNVLLYIAQNSFTLPFTRVNSVNVGLQSRAAAVATMDTAFNEHQVLLKIEDQQFTYSLEELGITIDSDSTYDNLREVNGFASLPVIKIFTNPMVRELPEYNINRGILEAKLATMIEASRTEPVSARIVVPDVAGEELSISESVNGYEINAELLADQIVVAIRAGTSAPSSLNLSGRTIAPAVREDQLQSAFTAANERVEQDVIVLNESGEEVTTVTATTLRQMLISNDDAELAFDEAELQEYLREDLWQYFFVAPTHERVSGETVETAGIPGVQLDLEDAFAVFQDEVASGATRIALRTIEQEPARIVDGVYPKTDMGLHALITDFDNEKRGDYRVIVHQLRGGDIRATHQGVESSIPASTYKAFIAYAAMWQTERGNMTLEDETGSGTVDECMFEMLHHSTDFCAFAIQDYMTWEGVDEVLRINGIENTFLANEDRIADKYTTAQDEYTLFKRLYDGTLLNEFHTEHLLTMLKEQKWRSGIPGGSSPSVVADKVGFYAGWINDVGIVYGDKADYIIIALSDGGSFWEINDLSRRIRNFFEN